MRHPTCWPACSPASASPPGARRRSVRRRLASRPSSAAATGTDLVLDGEARIVESAGQADHLLVTCSDGDGVTQVLVPATTPGVTMAPMQTVDLTRRFGAVTFDGATVPASAVVGTARRRPRRRRPPVRAAHRPARTPSRSGAMQAAFDMTVEWAFDRYSFGRPLASYQALKHRFADMIMWLEASHAISDAACAAVAAGDPDAAELVSAAKAYIGQYGAELLQDCVQMHGGHRRDLRARPAPVPAARHRQPGAGRHAGGPPPAHRRASSTHGKGRRRERACEWRRRRRLEEPRGLPATGPVLHPGQPAAGHPRGAALGAQRQRRRGGARHRRPGP